MTRTEGYITSPSGMMVHDLVVAPAVHDFTHGCTVQKVVRETEFNTAEVVEALQLGSALSWRGTTAPCWPCAAAQEEYWCEAELHRLKGELLVQQAEGMGSSLLIDAETCFRQALTVASRQYAKALELRAAMSLSQLWQRQGKSSTAYGLLAPIYAWFTEGFDTADLQEAKAWLTTFSRA